MYVCTHGMELWCVHLFSIGISQSAPLFIITY